MLVNAKDLPANSEIVADICIVGSGPAGIAIALEYDGLPLRVAIIEAGNEEKEPARSSRERVATDSKLGDFYFDMPGRQIGGSSVLWGIKAPGTSHGVRLLPLNAVDFERRDWMPESGWPVPPSYFDGYYQRAQAFFGLPQRPYTPDGWTKADSQPLTFASERVRTGVFQFADGELISRKYRARISASHNITLYTNASATKVRVDPATRTATALEVATTREHRLTVRAEQFALAAGAVWTTQLLMASGELGNAGGHLGRNLSVHPLLLGGRFRPATPELYARMKLYDMREVDGVGAMGHLQLGDDAVRREKLLGSSFLLFAVERGAKPELSPRQKRGFDGFMRIHDALKAGLKPTREDVLQLLFGFDGLVKRMVARSRHNKFHFDVGGWSALPDQATRFEGFEVFQITEQAQSPDNYLYLSDEENALGVRKIGVRWTYTPENAQGIRRSQLVFKEELAKAGLGEFEISSESDGTPTMINAHANHYFGSTRMSHLPEDGVVDTDCRVHGVDNLFVASSSVFPTGGFANPTLTIVALAQRVADNVRTNWLKSHPEAEQARRPEAA